MRQIQDLSPNYVYTRAPLRVSGDWGEFTMLSVRFTTLSYSIRRICVLVLRSKRSSLRNNSQLGLKWGEMASLFRKEIVLRYVLRILQYNAKNARDFCYYAIDVTTTGSEFCKNNIIVRQVDPISIVYGLLYHFLHK